MHIETEVRRAGTVHNAVESAWADFKKYFEARGFAAESATARTMALHHLRVQFAVEAPHRVKIVFDHFWKARQPVPLELLVTDHEKVFWMNTATNREYVSFQKALSDGVETDH